MNGTVAAAIVKGAVIGIAYVLTGVPHLSLFAVLTMALTMVSLKGGTSLSAAGLFGFGTAVLPIDDNFVQPALIGGTAQLPFLLVLIGILGGIESFGLVGLFLRASDHGGSLTVWREWIGVGDR